MSRSKQIKNNYNFKIKYNYYFKIAITEFSNHILLINKKRERNEGEGWEGLYKCFLSFFPFYYYINKLKDQPQIQIKIE